MLSAINLQTHAKTYDSPTKKSIEKEPPSSQPDGSLRTEKPTLDIMIRPPKAILRKKTHNPNTWETQYYSIVEDLTQAPCEISALEVLQTCHTQCKALLSTIDGLDPRESNLIAFDIEHYTPRLSHQLAFQIQVTVTEKLIHRTVVDEGETTSVMSISC